MGHRIVKTPNGKYAAFSDPVDHFVAYDMTREEAVKYCVEDWGVEEGTAEYKVQAADNDTTMEGGTGRYEEAMSTIRIIHGVAEERKYRKLLTL